MIIHSLKAYVAAIWELFSYQTAFLLSLFIFSSNMNLIYGDWFAHKQDFLNFSPNTSIYLENIWTELTKTSDSPPCSPSLTLSLWYHPSLLSPLQSGPWPQFPPESFTLAIFRAPDFPLVKFNKFFPGLGFDRFFFIIDNCEKSVRKKVCNSNQLWPLSISGAKTAVFQSRFTIFKYIFNMIGQNCTNKSKCFMSK